MTQIKETFSLVIAPRLRYHQIVGRKHPSRSEPTHAVARTNLAKAKVVTQPGNREGGCALARTARTDEAFK